MKLSRLERAIIIATMAHSGQTDKKGLPVILHPMTVMLKVTTESERIVAILHDVPEDTDFSAGFLLGLLDLTEEEYNALNALTHHKNESYADYIQRVKEAGSLAINVKLYDIEHNTSQERLAGLPEETVQRLNKKYKKALEILSNP